jgi:hypothetical protein
MIKNDLEKRIQYLEDIEAIKQLKARYALACDDHYNPAKIAGLFTEDGKFIGSMGETCGRQGLMEYFADVSKKIVSAVHLFMQPLIEINGDEASGLWYMWVPQKLDNGQCLLMTGIEVEKYRRVDGEWLIAEVRAARFFAADYAHKWEADDAPVKLAQSANMYR